MRTKILDHFTYDLVHDQREPSAHANEAALQEGEYYSNNDVIEDLTRESRAHMKEAIAAQVSYFPKRNNIEDYVTNFKNPSAKSGRYREKSDMVRSKRVLVFSWVGNDKPRYLWYPWATPTFEAVDSGFFKGGSASRVWKASLEAQKVHREDLWEKVVMYALALRAAQHGQSLDITDADHMGKRVRERFLKCFYSNGTFPSNVDRISKQPISKWWDYDNSL